MSCFPDPPCKQNSNQARNRIFFLSLMNSYYLPRYSRRDYSSSGCRGGASDLDNFWWTWEPTWRTFENTVYFFWQKLSEFTKRNLSLNSEMHVFCQKKTHQFFFLESSPCWLPGPPELSKSTRIPSDKKIPEVGHSH